MNRWILPFYRIRHIVAGWFFLTRTETLSLLLVLGVFLLGLVARYAWLIHD